ncbi:DUF423 domain-containing protein [Pseudoalteromonas byunsanensis]|uniref:DUF423 domain-containing protein n=1 Tax=Pseudoalteromonas byunsanensis TaxID=327939 RepID=A0A1S1MZK8_9GAMM|nr:DUF423 domain-containing protein [Pseudoalteromonas byunsanensis]OHU94215.1 hypothetical protein BIW53_16795 [Pseudoalteromonas byunsanensis]
MIKVFLLAGSSFCMLSVMLGAFAAHGLKRHLDDYALSIFKTASDYQMTHGLALIAVALLLKWGVKVGLSGWLLIAGIMLFSGSLYLLALTGYKWLGAITPIGGLCFIAAWLVLIVKISKHTF